MVPRQGFSLEARYNRCEGKISWRRTQQSPNELDPIRSRAELSCTLSLGHSLAGLFRVCRKRCDSSTVKRQSHV